MTEPLEKIVADTDEVFTVPQLAAAFDRMVGVMSEPLTDAELIWIGKLDRCGSEIIGQLIAEVRRLRGVEAARNLLLKGMESQAELMDGLKQECRELRAQVRRLENQERVEHLETELEHTKRDHEATVLRLTTEINVLAVENERVKGMADAHHAR